MEDCGPFIQEMQRKKNIPVPKIFIMPRFLKQEELTQRLLYLWSGKSFRTLETELFPFGLFSGGHHSKQVNGGFCHFLVECGH